MTSGPTDGAEYETEAGELSVWRMWDRDDVRRVEGKLKRVIGDFEWLITDTTLVAETIAMQFVCGPIGVWARTSGSPPTRRMEIIGISNVPSEPTETSWDASPKVVIANSDPASLYQREVPVVRGITLSTSAACAGDGVGQNAMWRQVVELVGIALAAECGRELRRVEERWEREVFIHDAAHGLASVESTVYGLHRKVMNTHVQAELDAARPMLDEYCSTLKREYAAHRWTLARLARWYSAGTLEDIDARDIAVIDLVDLLEGMQILYQELFASKGVALQYDHDRPDYDSMPLIRAEENAVKRALHNVIMNGLKYSYSSIATSERATARYVDIELVPRYSHDGGGKTLECAVGVENYGLPIYADELARVTRPRYRGRAALHENVWGSGLGLFETERILKQLGGRLRIRSIQQPGGAGVTKIWLIFPVR